MEIVGIKEREKKKLELRHIKLGAAVMFTLIVVIVEAGNNYANLRAIFELFSPSPVVGMLAAAAFVGLLFAGLVAKSLPFSRGVRLMLWLGIGFLFLFQSATNVCVGYTGLVARHDEADRMLVLVRLVYAQPQLTVGNSETIQPGYLLAATLEGIALPTVSLIFFGLAGSLYSQALDEFGLLGDFDEQAKTTKMPKTAPLLGSGNKQQQAILTPTRLSDNTHIPEELVAPHISKRTSLRKPADKITTPIRGTAIEVPKEIPEHISTRITSTGVETIDTFPEVNQEGEQINKPSIETGGTPSYRWIPPPAILDLTLGRDPHTLNTAEIKRIYLACGSSQRQAAAYLKVSRKFIARKLAEGQTEGEIATG